MEIYSLITSWELAVQSDSNPSFQASSFPNLVPECLVTLFVFVGLCSPSPPRSHLSALMKFCSENNPLLSCSSAQHPPQTYKSNNYLSNFNRHMEPLFFLIYLNSFKNLFMNTFGKFLSDLLISKCPSVALKYWSILKQSDLVGIWKMYVCK